MYALIIALLSGFAAGSIARAGNLSVTWSVLIGLFVLLAITTVISLVIRVKIKKLNADIQQVMEETRHRIMMMQNQFMRRPPGSQKVMLQA